MNINRASLAHWDAYHSDDCHDYQLTTNCQSQRAHLPTRPMTLVGLVPRHLANASYTAITTANDDDRDGDDENNRKNE